MKINIFAQKIAPQNLHGLIFKVVHFNISMKKKNYLFFDMIIKLKLKFVSLSLIKRLWLWHLNPKIVFRGRFALYLQFDQFFLFAQFFHADPMNLHSDGTFIKRIDVFWSSIVTTTVQGLAIKQIHFCFIIGSSKQKFNGVDEEGVQNDGKMLNNHVHIFTCYFKSLTIKKNKYEKGALNNKKEP